MDGQWTDGHMDRLVASQLKRSYSLVDTEEHGAYSQESCNLEEKIWKARCQQLLTALSDVTKAAHDKMTTGGSEGRHGLGGSLAVGAGGTGFPRSGRT